MLLELTEKWKLTTQNNAYDMEANQISKQNRYPWFTVWKIDKIRQKIEKNEKIFRGPKST